ncbi:FAD-dependent oxidoreductase [Mesorhizobium sp. WSM3860]|uniref:FAD-dependent oxidoreductase n=1 Tax=Mesorhizobium sp. WSM3860 TaxID=2029403 RepID=UPI001FE06222|nr:FAD-dependent oxidoreductase [Mesorhizobium sp. WSM3860]
MPGNLPTIKHKLWRKDLLWRVLKQDADVVIIGAGSPMRQPIPAVPKRATLMHPVAEKIFFAGEHVARPLIQTCGSARLSGESVARRVVALLATKCDGTRAGDWRLGDAQLR